MSVLYCVPGPPLVWFGRATGSCRLRLALPIQHPKSARCALSCYRAQKSCCRRVPGRMLIYRLRLHLLPAMLQLLMDYGAMTTDHVAR